MLYSSAVCKTRSGKLTKDSHCPTKQKSRMRVAKRPSKKAVKKLHGALKNMLKREHLGIQPESNKRPTIPDITEVVKEESLIDNTSPIKAGSEAVDPPASERNGVLYIMSKENQLIPKLTDEKVMELHKRADENMKRAWSEIITKYETVENQGDIIDMQTGELIEDNGHLRGISQEGNQIRYKSTLQDFIGVGGDESKNYDIWQDEGEEEDEVSEDYEDEDYETQKSYTESNEGDTENEK